MNNAKRYTHVEWMAEGKRRFGDYPLLFQFVCPSCGHVQTPENFRGYQSKGANSETAMFNCIGRYDGKHGDTPLFTKPGPCNYTSGGLLNLNPVVVTFPGGEEVRIFDFATPPATVAAPTEPDHGQVGLEQATAASAHSGGVS